MEHFEEKIAKTKAILQQLGTQDLSLKESLSLYKQGMQELKSAQKLLEKAKLEYEEMKLLESVEKNIEESVESQDSSTSGSGAI